MFCFVNAVAGSVDLAGSCAGARGHIGARIEQRSFKK